jgi:WD40 repeat protein
VHFSGVGFGSRSAGLNLWDPSNCRPIRRLEGQFTGINSAAFSADGEKIAVKSDQCKLNVWNARIRLARSCSDFEINRITSPIFRSSYIMIIIPVDNVDP